MIQEETKSVLPVTDIFKHNTNTTQTITTEEIQADYDYFLAQEICTKLLDTGLITPEEFNKISLLNRKTFSPLYAALLPNIT